MAVQGPGDGRAYPRWYARLRGSASQLDIYREQARELVAGLTSGARVLEVAPGPGFLSIEMARFGKVQVTGLDISRTFVQIAAANARRAGVTVDFRQGDAQQMPFASGSFDMIVCQAAFKNFALPGTALAEMHRVLRAGGRAVIQDMSKDATHADIDDEVNGMDLGWISAFTTRATLEMLKRRAYSPHQFRQLVAESPFRTCHITTRGVGLEVQLEKEKDQ